uniref:Platelet-derived growth factor beta polypeptide a n=1 Tax=Astyanax mexicanus TaxID=7994 RepID=A0A3B1JZF1_ASTMX
AVCLCVCAVSVCVCMCFGCSQESLPPSLVDLVMNSPISSMQDLQRLLDVESVEEEEDEVHPNGTHKRLPRSLAGVQVAQQAMCKVRTEVMEVTRAMLDRRNANFLLWPLCVEVQRCSGCCNTRTLQCVPVTTETRHLQMTKIQFINRQPVYEKVVIPVEDHLTCSCQSRAVAPAPRAKATPPPPPPRLPPKVTPPKIQSKEELHRHDDLKQNQRFHLEDRETQEAQWQSKYTVTHTQGSPVHTLTHTQGLPVHTLTHTQGYRPSPVQHTLTHTPAGTHSSTHLGSGDGSSKVQHQTPKERHSHQHHQHNIHLQHDQATPQHSTPIHDFSQSHGSNHHLSKSDVNLHHSSQLEAPILSYSHVEVIGQSSGQTELPDHVSGQSEAANHNHQTDRGEHRQEQSQHGHHHHHHHHQPTQASSTAGAVMNAPPTAPPAPQTPPPPVPQRRRRRKHRRRISKSAMRAMIM